MDMNNSIALSMSDKINQDMREALTKEKVNFKVPAEWYSTAVMAMRFATPVLLGLSADKYKDLYIKLERQTRLNCFDFAGLNNKIEELTADKLKLDINLYIHVQQIVEKLAAQWTEQTAALRKDIMDRTVEGARTIKMEPNLAKL